MKKTLRSSVASLAILTGAVGAVATTAVVQVPSASATVMMTHSWHGTIEKVDAMMGKDGKFTLKDGMKIYTVHYTAMTKFTLGSPKKLKAGGMAAVTGTLSGSTIMATKITL